MGLVEIVSVNNMTDLKNITGLGKPLTKLIGVVAEGLGETANMIFDLDARKIKRIGRAEAEIEKQKIIKKAEGSSEALEILDRASKRFALEQYNKQINLENIIVGTRDLLEGQEVSDMPVEKDWITRFMNTAQDISREEVQKILSKILAGEIKQPNSFSLKTLDFIRNLEKDDLLLFKKISILISGTGNIFLTENNANEKVFNISYGELMKLIEIGLIQSSITTVLNLSDCKKDSPHLIKLKNGLHIFKFILDKDKIVLPVLQLTSIGFELDSVLSYEKESLKILDDYLDELKTFWGTKNIEFVATKGDTS